MKEKTILNCRRCLVEVSVDRVSYPSEMKRLGWIGLETRSTLVPNFYLCPHCTHECKRFLAGCEIKALSHD